MPNSILIVDDDTRILTSLAQALEREAGEVRCVESAEAALSAVGELRPELVLADVRMPGMDGLELLSLLKERAPETDVILMTAFDDLATVAMAMRQGAADFLVKPLDLHQLRTVVSRVFDDRQARERAEKADRPKRAPGAGTAEARGVPEQPALVGRDRRMVEIFKVVGQAAASQANVVIRGESGTGKELIARVIHANSPWSDEPFVAVNCTALPTTLLESELFGHVRGSFTGATSDRKGRFEMAGRGTIFLDEIGDTSPEFQGKLLRVLQEQEFYPVGAEKPRRTEARVVAATHRDLEAMVASGDFREDLYYRLRVVEIALPPLRDRRGDVPLLAEHLVEKASRRVGREPPVLSDEARSALLAHRWPGNVRELENCLTRAVVMATGEVIRPEHLAIGGAGGAAPGAAAGATGGLPDPGALVPHGEHATLDELEGRYVARILEATDWHKTRTAEILDISRPRLNRIIERQGLEEGRPGGPGPDRKG